MQEEISNFQKKFLGPKNKTRQEPRLKHYLYKKRLRKTPELWSVCPAESDCRSAGRQCRFLKKREEVSRMGS